MQAGRQPDSQSIGWLFAIRSTLGYGEGINVFLGRERGDLLKNEA